MKAHLPLGYGCSTARSPLSPRTPPGPLPALTEHSEAASKGRFLLQRCRLWLAEPAIGGSGTELRVPARRGRPSVTGSGEDKVITNPCAVCTGLTSLGSRAGASRTPQMGSPWWEPGALAPILPVGRLQALARQGGATPQLTHGCPTALLGCRGTGWSSRQECDTRAAALLLVLGALQEVIYDVAHAVHLVTWGHPPVEAVPAEVVFVWGKEAAR